MKIKKESRHRVTINIALVQYMDSYNVHHELEQKLLSWAINGVYRLVSKDAEWYLSLSLHFGDNNPNRNCIKR